MDFLRNLQIDRISFWIGFAAGIVFAWLASTLKRYLPDFLKFTRERMQAARESISTGVEIRLRNDMVRLAQRQHIASTLFSLDEVAIEPRLIAPSPTVSAPDEPLPIDMVQLTVPYTPDWPALANLACRGRSTEPCRLAVVHLVRLRLVMAQSGGVQWQLHPMRKVWKQCVGVEPGVPCRCASESLPPC